MSPEEIGYYAQLFAQVDVDGQGRLSGLQAADFFSGSGLDRRTLKQIWDIADSGTRGWLGRDEFVAALRLVAHAQAGRAVSRDLVYIAPPAPPRFGGAPAPPPSSAPGLPASRRGRSPARGSEQDGVPSPRDLRKYARLFERATAGRARLDAGTARDLFGRSGLSTGVLARAWDISDADRDGHLSWSEFVVAMHLIRAARKGREPPQALPMELVAFVAGLGPSDFYARQASRSPRASSAVGSAIFDSAPATPRSHSPAAAGGSETAAPQGGMLLAQPPSAFDDAARHPASRELAPRKMAPDLAAAAAEDAGSKAWADSDFEGPPSPPPPPPRSRRWEDDPVTPSPNASAEESDEQRASPDFGGRRRRRKSSGADWKSSCDDWSAGVGFPRADAQPVEHLEVLIEAEKRLVHQLQADTDELNEDLERLEEACRWEEKEAAREQSESGRIASERRYLQEQLEASHLQLRALKAERQELHVESILLRRDQGHYGSELAFLQRLLDEGAKDMEALHESIAYLEQSNQSLTSHTRSLEEARKEVQRQAQAERELLRKEQEAAQRAKQALEMLSEASGPSAFSSPFPPSVPAK